MIRMKCWNIYQTSIFLTHSPSVFIIWYNNLAAWQCNQDLTLLYWTLEKSKTSAFMCLKCTPAIVLVWTDFVGQTQLWHRSNYSKIPTSPEHAWSNGSSNLYVRNTFRDMFGHISLCSASMSQTTAIFSSVVWPFLLRPQNCGCNEKQCTYIAPPRCVFSLNHVSILLSLLLHGHNTPFYSDITDFNLMSSLYSKLISDND